MSEASSASAAPPASLSAEQRALATQLGLEFDPTKIDVEKIIAVVRLVWQVIAIVGPIFLSESGELRASAPANQPRGMTAQGWHKQLAAKVGAVQAQALLATLEHIRACGE